MWEFWCVWHGTSQINSILNCSNTPINKNGRQTRYFADIFKYGCIRIAQIERILFTRLYFNLSIWYLIKNKHCRMKHVHYSNTLISIYIHEFVVQPVIVCAKANQMPSDEIEREKMPSDKMHIHFQCSLHLCPPFSFYHSLSLSLSISRPHPQCNVCIVEW